MPFVEIPNQIFVRLLLTFDNIIFKKFYWFEMKSNDFYWGSAYKLARAENAGTTINDTRTIVTIPDHFDKLPRLPGKYSYHESGATHYKSQLKNGLSINSEHSKWKLKGDITKPVRFYTIISRTLKHYDKNISNSNKNKAYAMALNFDPKHTHNRVYFEFFLSPEGTFNIPETLIKMQGDKPLTEIVTHSLSHNLILIVRFAVMSNMNEWHPDKEIVIMPTNLD